MIEVYERDITAFITTMRPGFSAGTEESLFESQLLDSMNLSELMGFLEGSYQIKIFPRDITPENFDSVKNLASFVQRKKAA